jgi:hypothetical protein
MEKIMQQYKTIFASVFVFLFVWSSVVFANEPSDLPEQFMKQIIAGNGGVAVDKYFSTNPMIMQKLQQIEVLKTQIEAVTKVFGKPTGYEIVSQETIAPSVRRFVYISKNEYHALTWEFFVYKPNDVWIASNMIFDDDFSHARSWK